MNLSSFLQMLGFFAFAGVTWFVWSVHSRKLTWLVWFIRSGKPTLSKKEENDKNEENQQQSTVSVSRNSQPILPVSSPPILPVSSSDCSSCQTDYSDTESFLMICFPDSNLQPVEEVQLDAVELLKLYEEKLNDVQNMSLFVQDLMEKGECTVELFQSFKKSMGNLHRMHEKLRRVISNGLQQRRSLGHKKHNQLEQANNEFMRINQKNSRLLNGASQMMITA